MQFDYFRFDAGISSAGLVGTRACLSLQMVPGQGEGIPLKGMLWLMQALADYADLITFLKHDRDSTDSAVIGFGGSYGADRGKTIENLAVLFLSIHVMLHVCHDTELGIFTQGGIFDGRHQRIWLTYQPEHEPLLATC